MKNIFRLYFIIFTLLITTIPLCAQWVHTNGPYGSGVNCFAVNGSNLYAGTVGGVYLSINFGTSWTDISSGLLSLDIRALAVAPDGKGGTNLFAGVWDDFAGVGGLRGAIFRSTDNGISWTKVFVDNLDSQLGRGVMALLAHPNKTGGTDLFASFYLDGRIFLSTDNGSYWKEVIRQSQFNAFTSIDSNIFAGGNNIYLTNDNGVTWTESDSGITNLVAGSSVSALVVNGTNIFAGISNTVSDTNSCIIYLSTDNGKSWNRRGSGINATKANSLAVIGNNILAGTDNGIYVSNDNGMSWSAANTGLETIGIGPLAVIGTNIFASTQHGVFLSTNNGSSWNPITGLIPLFVSTLSSNGTDLLAGTYRGVYLSTDNGNNWAPRNTGWPDYSITALAARGSNIYAGTYGGVYVSTDNGSSWGIRDTGIVTQGINALAINGTDIYAAGGRNVEYVIVNNRPKALYHLGMYRSSNNGMNWAMIDSGLAGGQVVSLAIDSSITDHRVIYATTMYPDYSQTDTSSGIYCSTNNGITWSRIKTLDNNYSMIQTLGIVSNGNGGTNLIAPYLLFTHVIYGHYIYGANISTDAGATWNKITSSTPTKSIIYSCAVSGTSIFAGSNLGVIVSNNSGMDWLDANNGLTNLNVRSLFIKDGNLYAGTGNGVWKRSLSEITDVDNSYVQVPLHFTLNQNYPNPFNPTTTIRYSVPKSQFVTLKVFDVLGREIRTLVNENKNVGNYEVSFDASALTSGIYFYQLKSGNYSATKKLVLLK